MNVFFGKISQKVDIAQIKEGYYQAPKDSNWYGELKIGDYVYLIGSNKIQFWQAERWEKHDENDRLYFKILNNDLDITTKDLIRLKFLRLTVDLIVKTVRSTGMEGCAFFKLDMIADYSIDKLSSTSFYKDQSLYRNIEILKESQIKEKSDDIQLYQDNTKQLCLYKSAFWDESVYNDFKDNLECYKKGQKNKDKTIEMVNKHINNNDVSTLKDFNLLYFYDAFFCDYKEKDIETAIKEDIIKEEYDYFLHETLQLLEQKKNLILQGAPGTGKTYKTAEIAVALCNGIDSLPNSREKIMMEYQKLVEQERIVFTTFHQSMDYEEFVEGIKPEVSGDSIVYNTKDGLFKQICNNAKSPIIENNNLKIRNNPTIWKVSLKGTYENEVRTDCLINNRIRIGWDQYGAVLEDDSKYEDGGKVVLDAFINKMQIGDIIMSCYSNRIIDAIGIITGEYHWDDTLENYKRCRSVEWLVKDIKEDIYDINKQTVMTLSTVYRLNNLTLESIMNILAKYKVGVTTHIQKNSKPYILIIDEINRANLSKVFGELITLLEADKRLGMTNKVEVKLPYTQTTFGIPENLFIIGTMNTADRSLGYIDYAIRRRFAFKTLQSNRSVIENYYADTPELRNKILGLFEKIRIFMEQHIEVDFSVQDLMLGHSYFLANQEDILLKLQYEIIPLLIEYEKDGVLRVSKDNLSKFCEECLQLN